MAPRRTSAHGAPGAGTPAKQGTGGEGDGAAKPALGPSGLPGPTSALNGGRRGGGGVESADHVHAGAVSWYPAAGSGHTEKLQAALAELKVASSERQEASAGRREALAQWQATESQTLTTHLAAVTGHGELQREVAWLRKAELQHQRISELLEVLSETERLATAQQVQVTVAGNTLTSPSVIAGDIACIEALQCAQQSMSALVHDTSERLFEVERMCTSIGERTAHEHAQSLRAAEDISELQGRLEVETEQRAEALRLEAEAAQQTAQAVRHGCAEVRAVRDEAEQLAAEVERLQRVSMQSQGHIAAEQQEVCQLERELDQLRAELSSENSSCMCKTNAADLQVGCSPPDVMHSRDIANGVNDVQLDAMEHLPVQLGVSTVAELAMLIFGDIKRPLEAADFKVFKADALAKLPFSRKCPVLKVQAEQSGMCWRKEVALDADDYEDGFGPAAIMELDQTMKWLMEPDAGTNGQIIRSLADDERTEEPSPPPQLPEPCSRCHAAEARDDEDVEWDDGVASSDYGEAVAELLEPMSLELLADTEAPLERPTLDGTPCGQDQPPAEDTSVELGAGDAAPGEGLVKDVPVVSDQQECLSPVVPVLDSTSQEVQSAYQERLLDDTSSEWDSASVVSGRGQDVFDYDDLAVPVDCKADSGLECTDPAAVVQESPSEEQEAVNAEQSAHEDAGGEIVTSPEANTAAQESPSEEQEAVNAEQSAHEDADEEIVTSPEANIAAQESPSEEQETVTAEQSAREDAGREMATSPEANTAAQESPSEELEAVTAEQPAAQDAGREIATSPKANTAAQESPEEQEAVTAEHSASEDSGRIIVTSPEVNTAAQKSASEEQEAVTAEQSASEDADRQTVTRPESITADPAPKGQDEVQDSMTTKDLAAEAADGSIEAASAPGSVAIHPKPLDASPPSGQLWQVIGGTEFGGIRVREGREMNTEFLPWRLSTGALVRELELCNERLFYQKVEGDGPFQGWVTIRVSGKDLLVKKAGLAVPSSPDCSKSKADQDLVADEGTVAVRCELRVQDGFDDYQRQHCLGNSLVQPFLHALEKREARMMRRLILQRAPVDVADNQGRTPLLRAVGWQSEKLCKLLLKFGAHPDWPPQRSAAEAAAALKRDRRNSPVPALFEAGQPRSVRQGELHEAAMSGDIAVIQVLVANCGLTEQGRAEVLEDLNCLDVDGWTPLHLSVLSGSGAESLRTMNALLKECADIDALDGRGETPLMLAVRHAKDLLTCKFLLDARADLLHKNALGKTAIDLALELESPDEDTIDTLMGYATNEWWSQAESFIFCNGPAKCGLGAKVPRLHLPLPPLSCAWPKVSVICPTVPSRGRFHQQVYKCFAQQTYPEKELVVVDSGPEPSSFFSSGGPTSDDPRVVYRWRRDTDDYDPQRPEEGHGVISVGIKRGMAIRASTGTIIAHFDDDDFYGPGYLEQMVSVMLRHGADAVKLSSFFVFDCQSGRLGYCDPEGERRDKNDKSMDEFILGYGFSYVYRRALAEKRPFPNAHFGEDYAFLAALQQDGNSVCLWPDLDGICLHMQHGRNTSLAFCADAVPRTAFPSMEVYDCELLPQALKTWPEKNTVDPLSVIPVGARGSRRSGVLGLALQILDRRTRLAGRVPSGGLGPPVLEARALLGDRVLDDVSPAGQVRRERKLEIVDEMGGAVRSVLAPWTATVSRARRAASELLGLRAGFRLVLRDAEQELDDRQLLLGRRSLWYTIE